MPVIRKTFNYVVAVALLLALGVVFYLAVPRKPVLPPTSTPAEDAEPSPSAPAPPPTTLAGPAELAEPTATAAAPTPTVRAQTAPPTGSADGRVTPEKPEWVTIEYGDLLDPEAVVRSGQKVKVSLLDPRLRGYVQPFVDGFSSLLPYVVEMVRGPDAKPQQSLADRYSPGSAQPVWEAVLRGGRVFISGDGEGQARLFLTGDDARTAWKEHYSFARHPLNSILPPDGSPLHVEVFAYRNDYARAELRLNLRSYRFSTFGLPGKKTPPNLDALDDFFREGGQLEGAQVDREDGLVMYASAGAPQLLSGNPVTLADFAVAYRAAFHAGDNGPYVSLDPGPDQTRVNVNFGGFLEDTRVGAVMLQADKRFKTFVSGLDQDRLRDIRGEVREAVPDFLTSSEYMMKADRHSIGERRMNLRFWFYPDSIGVDTDGVAFAVVTRPQFTADAERSLQDFDSPEEFERKKALLLPGIRENIDAINREYALFAGLFPELRELNVVARLMAVASWLRRQECSWLDLDDLMDVVLPAFATERERPQLISTQTMITKPGMELTADYVRRESETVAWNSVLDRTVEDYFGTPERFALYLCRTMNVGKESCRGMEEDAARIFEGARAGKVRDLIKSKSDLFALAFYAEESTHEIPYRRVIVGIGGGVNMEPKYFKIRREPESQALARFKALAERTAPSWGSVEGSGKWIRSRGRGRKEGRVPEGKAPPSHKTFQAGKVTPPTAASARGPKDPKAETAEEAPPVRPAIAVRETVRIPETAAAKAVAGAVGQRAPDGRIVFTRRSP